MDDSAGFITVKDLRGRAAVLSVFLLEFIIRGCDLMRVLHSTSCWGPWCDFVGAVVKLPHGEAAAGPKWLVLGQRQGGKRGAG